MPFALEQLSQGLSIAARIDPQNLAINTSVNTGNSAGASKFRRMMAVVLVGAGGGPAADWLAARRAMSWFAVMRMVAMRKSTRGPRLLLEFGDCPNHELVKEGHGESQVAVSRAINHPFLD